MDSRKMHHQLEMIDGALAELEERRTELVNRINNSNSLERGSKVLQFPGRIAVQKSAKNSRKPNPWN
jgi:hypothetical protein